GALTFQEALRLLVLERDIFFLGTAITEHSWSGIEQVLEGREGRIGVIPVPVARISIQVGSASWAKSLAVRLAHWSQRDRQDQLIGGGPRHVHRTVDDGVSVLVGDLREMLVGRGLQPRGPLGGATCADQI